MQTPMNAVKALFDQEHSKEQRALAPLIEEAKQLGQSDQGLNLNNAVLAVVKSSKTAREATEQAYQHGYSTLGKALEALSKHKPEPELPEAFRYHPAHWECELSINTTEYYTYRGSQERRYKVPAVTATRAQADLKRIKPLLLEVIELMSNDEGTLEKNLQRLEIAFKAEPYNTFVSLCYDFLRGYDEIEEEPKETTAPEADNADEHDALYSMYGKPGEHFDEEAALTLLALT
jgi:hypothetical protein